MEKSKINRETAEAELEKWLDRKKVFQETRERYKDYSEIIVEALMNGVLVLNSEKGEFTHTLLFPLNESGSDTGGIETLTYKLRVNDKLVLPHTRGLKNDDNDGRFNALLAAITSQSRSVIISLDSADKRIAFSIGIFFS